MKSSKLSKLQSLRKVLSVDQVIKREVLESLGTPAHFNSLHQDDKVQRFNLFLSNITQRIQK